MIKIRNLSKTYTQGGKKLEVLKNASLEIKDGEIVALLGRSGSGKSTLLNLISGLDSADKGNIEVDNIDITSLSEKEKTLFRRKNIGLVFQFFNLIPTLTVEENVMLPLELNSISRNGKINLVLESVGMNDRLNSFPDLLSGGEQQRVAIARAIIHDPKLILADEPTGNLDLDNAKNVTQILEKIVRERGKTMLIATHSRELAKIANRVVNINHGVIEELKPENPIG